MPTKKEIQDKVEAEMKAAELKKRTDAFNKELIPLLGKYKVGLGAEPMMLNKGNGEFTLAARPVIFDDAASFEKKKVDEKPADKESDLASA